MRRFLLAVPAIALLSACGQKNEAADGADAAQADASGAAADAQTQKPEVEMPAGFPKMKATYRATYATNVDGEGPKEMTLEVAGEKKMRFEMPHFDAARAAAGATMVGVFDETTSRYIMFAGGEGAAKAAVVMPFEENIFDMFHAWQNEAGERPTKVGADSVAGLKCEVWELAADAEGEAASQACITRDGIILRAGDKGAATPDMIATKVDKGRIDPARFAVPAGYEIIDMGPCQQAMQEAMATAQAGGEPDFAKMQECQALSMKAAAVFGETQ